MQGPPESAKDKPSKSSKPVKAAKDKAKADKASKDTRSKHVKEPEPEPMDAVDESVLEHVPTSSAEVKQSPESANKPLDKAADGPDLNIEAILVADSQEVAEEAPEPEIKAKGGRRKAAAGGRKKATTKRKGKQQVELEEEAEAEDSSQVAESASQVPASQQSASQGPTSQSFSQAPASLPASQVVDSQEASTPPENEDEDSAPSKKGGRKIRLRKQPASGKEKEAPGTNADAAKGAALGRGARGKKEVKPAKTEAELTVDDEAEKSMTEEQLPAKRADEKMVPDSATIDERKATGQAVESVAKSMPAAGPKSSEPIVSRFAGTNFVALAQQRKEELTESRQQSDAHTRESDLLNKRPIVENVRPVSKKPRHDLFPEVKVPAMKLPRLADTLSSVDFALRPSIATNMDSIVHEPESHAAAEIVERAETEAARQDERLQTIIKSSVDKLKGDLFRLKKTAGSDSSSSSGGSSGPSSQGSMEPARVRSALDNAKLSNKASESDWSRPNRDGSRDRERAGPSELTSPPTETSQKQRPQESRVADESQNQGSEDHLATSQGFNLIRETMPETSQPSQASIESESRLSMSFFGAVHVSLPLFRLRRSNNTCLLHTLRLKTLLALLPSFLPSSTRRSRLKRRNE